GVRGPAAWGRRGSAGTPRSPSTPPAHPPLRAVLPLPAVDEAAAGAPAPLPSAAAAGRLQPPAPLRLRPPGPGRSVRRRRGVQPGVVPQPGQDVDAPAATFREDQRPHEVPQGVAAVEDAQVLPAGGDPRLLAEQLDGQLALGPERRGAAGAGRQLRGAEVEPAGDRQEPSGLGRLVEQGAEDEPVVGADGAGPVGAAGGGLVEGAGPPDVGAGTMDLGVVDGRGDVAVPGPTRRGLDQAGQVVGDAALVPAAVLGEGLQGLPGGGPLQRQGRLGDGVLLDVERQGGGPLGGAAGTAAGGGGGGSGGEGWAAGAG